MRDGRGQLSSIDLLPDEARDDVHWALGQLANRQRTQADILFEFNDRLQAKGIGPISKSAFHRKSMRQWSMMRDWTERNQIMAAIAEHMPYDKIDEQTVILGEFLKLVIYDLQAPGSAPINADGIMKIARAYRDIISGQKISGERRAALQKEFSEKAVQAVELAAKQKGLSAETVSAIKSEILGIKDEQPRAA